ncbi:hypothetical protein JXI42_14505 [bacterium]|nr:hypothetical protein [bacterium]
MEGEPNKWWRNTARLIINFRRTTQEIPDSDVRVYFEFQIPDLLDRLRRVSGSNPQNEDGYASLADNMIMDLSMEQAAPYERRDIHIETFFLPIDVMVGQQPERFKTEDRMIGGIDCRVLRVMTPITHAWQEIPLPKRGDIWHKGGGSRLPGDVVFHSPFSMQESESPLYDHDVLTCNGCPNEVAFAIGVDADGIEHMGEDKLNFARYCAGRDTTQNQILLGAEGLYYSREAMMSAITGHTRIENEYVANKAIYGFDKMIVQGETLAKARGLMRMVKAVTEGKALSFDHVPLNARFDMGVSTLFLAKRWSSKEHFPELLQRMFFLLKQMGQIREGEFNIFDTLERAHRENSFYDFDSEVRFPIQVARWKARKLAKQIDREMGWRFHIPTGMIVNRFPGDNIPSRISLDNFTLDPEQLDVQERWDAFTSRSRERTAKHEAEDHSPYEKIFMFGYEDREELGTSADDAVFMGGNEF